MSTETAAHEGSGAVSQPRTHRLLKTIALIVTGLAIVALVLLRLQSGHGVFLTPDQRGHRLFEKGRFAEAAEAFRDSQWKGAAWYRAGEFEKAAQAFARRESAEAQYNAGNAWVMLGKYANAISAYDKALARKPGWREARENRDLAAARAKLVEQKGGDLGDQREGADKVVFDAKKQPGGQDTQLVGEKAADDASMQAMWLRRVDTRPADFLKAKFAYQQAMKPQEEAKP